MAKDAPVPARVLQTAVTPREQVVWCMLVSVDMDATQRRPLNVGCKDLGALQVPCTAGRCEHARHAAAVLHHGHPAATARLRAAARFRLPCDCGRGVQPLRVRHVNTTHTNSSCLAMCLLVLHIPSNSIQTYIRVHRKNLCYGILRSCPHACVVTNGKGGAGEVNGSVWCRCTSERCRVIS